MGIPDFGFNHRDHQSVFTGPSTNGRSSAFGALCLGSNPSGPAKKPSWVVRPLSLASTASAKGFGQRPTTNDQRRFYGYSRHNHGEETRSEPRGEIRAQAAAGARGR